MSEPVTIQAITTLGLIIVAYLGNRKLNSIRSDARTAADQTANAHADAEYPNLRDEITAMHADVRATRGLVHGLERCMTAVEARMDDLSRDDRTLEDTIRRKDRAATQALAGAVEDRNLRIEDLTRRIPTIVRESITSHIGACPLRNPGDEN